MMENQSINSEVGRYKGCTEDRSGTDTEVRWSLFLKGTIVKGIGSEPRSKMAEL
jgi:hypothetical protein